jgi:3',5'-nucleoside bisphosphate phosphatase
MPGARALADLRPVRQLLKRSRTLPAVALRFDLQSHSTHSDGALPAADVVQRAADAGVQLLALSDHDTVSGVSEAIAAGQRLGVRVVPAVEISAVDTPTGIPSGAQAGEGSQVPRELHILGYDIDHTGPVLTSRLAEFLADREHRTLRMRDALREVGFDLDEAEIDARVAAGKPIGRPHLAAAVLGAPANAERLRDEHIDDVGSLIRGYLIEGKPAFRLRQTPTVAEAIDAIHQAGGVAVWAHPFWDVSDPGEVLSSIDRFHAFGIDGVEAFYVTHTREQTELLAARCAELGLLTTGSADFHGPENRQFSKFMAFDTFGLAPNLGPIA